MTYDFNWLYTAISGGGTPEPDSTPTVASTSGGGLLSDFTKFDMPGVVPNVVKSTPTLVPTPTPPPVVSYSTSSDITSDTINSWFSPGSSGVSAPTSTPTITGTPEPSSITLPSITKGGGATAPSTVSNLWRPSEAVDRWAAPKPKPYRIPSYSRGTFKAPSGASRYLAANRDYNARLLGPARGADVEEPDFSSRGTFKAPSGADRYLAAEDSRSADIDYSDDARKRYLAARDAYDSKPGYFASTSAGPDDDAPEGMDWVIRETPSGESTWALVPEGESSRPSAREGGGGYRAPAALVRSDGSSTPGGSGAPGGGGGYYPSGYGGYGGTTAGGEAEVPETLGELTWWGPDAVTPLLKGWGKWLRELVEINAESRPVPYLFDFEPEVDESAELRTVLENLEGLLGKPGGTAEVPAFSDFTAGGKESLSPRMRAVLRELSDRRQRGGSTLGYIEQLIDESRGEGEDARPWEELLRMAQSGEGGESALDQLLAQYSSVAEEWDDTVPQLKTPQPGVGSVSGILKRLQRMLGVETADDASQTEKWQQLINKIPGASFEAQQLMHSLTFDQSGKWMTQSSSMLPNPAFT